MREILLHFFLKYKGDWDAIYKALENKEKVSLKTLTELNRKRKNYITILDGDYPEELKLTENPPFVFHKDSHWQIELTSLKPDKGFRYKFEGGIYQEERDGK